MGDESRSSFSALGMPDHAFFVGGPQSPPFPAAKLLYGRMGRSPGNYTGAEAISVTVSTRLLGLNLSFVLLIEQAAASHCN